MQSNKIKLWLPVIWAIISINSCSSNSGTSSPSNTPAVPTSVKDIQVPDSAQINTPLFLSNRSALRYGVTNVNNSVGNSNQCFKIQPNTDGSNYILSYNSSQWWSTGILSFKVINTCNTAQLSNINVKAESLKLNGSQLAPSAISFNQTATPYMNIVTTSDNDNINIAILPPSCDGDYCNWAKVPANTINTYQLNVSLGAPITSLTLKSLTIDGDTPPPPPPPSEKGTIQLNLDAQKIPVTTDCNIKVILNGDGLKIAQGFDYNYCDDPYLTVNISNIDAGIYWFSFDHLPSNVSVKQTPDKITVNGGATAASNVSFISQNPQLLANVKVNLNKIADIASYDQLKTINNIVVDLIDDTSKSAIHSAPIAMGGNYIFTGIDIAHTYHLVTYSIGNALGGVYYTAKNIAINGLKVNETKNIDINYEKYEQPLVSVNIEVSGLNNNRATIQFAPTNANIIYATNNLITANYKFMDNQQALAVTASKVDGLTDPVVTPNVFNPASTQSVKIVYSIPTVSKHLVVGYIDFTAAASLGLIPTNAIKQYDIINLAFYLDQNCNTEGVILALNKVLDAHVDNMKIFLSVGGDKFPGLDNTDINSFASNLINFISNINTKMGSKVIVGVDLDIEAGSNSAQITALAKALHNAGYLVSIAPQASTVPFAAYDVTHPSKVVIDHPSNFALVTSGSLNVYADSVASGYVDYINLQAYNSGPGVIAIGDNMIDENNPMFHEYMAQVLNNLVSDNCGTMNPTTQFYNNNAIVCIPKTTKIIIGTVANKTAGGLNTMWREDNQTIQSDNTILDKFTQSVISATKYPYYSGVMVWSLNNDCDPADYGDTWGAHCMFSNNIPNFKFKQ